MTSIKWDSKLNEEAGFLVPKDGAKLLSSTDKKTLLNLIWTFTYTEAGRTVLKENRPNKPLNGGAPVKPADVEANLTKWINDFGVHDPTVVKAVIDAHLAADAWIDARNKDLPAEQAKQQKIYQQNVAVVTWMLWEDAMGHEFSMNW